MTPTPYTPAADAIDALADRIAAATLDTPHSLEPLAAVLDLHARRAEPYDVQAAVRMERLAGAMRVWATARPFRPVSVVDRTGMVTTLRHQAVFVRRAEAAAKLTPPPAAPALSIADARARRRSADAARPPRPDPARLDHAPDGGSAA